MMISVSAVIMMTASYAISLAAPASDNIRFVPDKPIVSLTCVIEKNEAENFQNQIDSFARKHEIEPAKNFVNEPKLSYLQYFRSRDGLVLIINPDQNSVPGDGTPKTFSSLEDLQREANAIRSHAPFIPRQSVSLFYSNSQMDVNGLDQELRASMEKFGCTSS